MFPSKSEEFSYYIFFQNICVEIFSQNGSNKTKVETFPLLAQVHVYAKSPLYVL